MPPALHQAYHGRMATRLKLTHYPAASGLNLAVSLFVGSLPAVARHLHPPIFLKRLDHAGYLFPHVRLRSEDGFACSKPAFPRLRE